MVLDFNEYKRARLMRGEPPRAPHAGDTRITGAGSNVFRFRHPNEARRAPAKAPLAYAEMDEDLDRVYALASQS